MSDTAPRKSACYMTLTVPQLRSLCKEKKITGYSKLGKAALIETLSSRDSQSERVGIDSGHLASAPPSKPPGSSVVEENVDSRTPTFVDQSISEHPTVRDEVFAPNHRSAATPASGGFEIDSAVAATAHVTIQATSPAQNMTLASSLLKASVGVRPSASSTSDTDLNSQEFLSVSAVPHGLKRTRVSRITVQDTTPKKLKLAKSGRSDEANEGKDQVSATSGITSAPSSLASTGEGTGECYIARKPGIAYLPTGASKRDLSGSSVPLTTLSTSRTIARFKPLKVSQRPNREENAPVDAFVQNQGQSDTSVANENGYLAFESIPDMALEPISLPPSLAQRKTVHLLSIILSDLGTPELQQCLKASRVIRYAVYLSAAQIIRREFGDGLYAELKRRYNLSMTNCWPYLSRLRMGRKLRLRAYGASFLRRFFGKRNPISSHLWGSPDGNALTMALRFLVTRLWFAISVEGRDKSLIKKSVVMGSEEIVKDEIWRIHVRVCGPPGAPTSYQSFYILEPSCEVIGLPSNTETDAPTHPTPLDSVFLRVDWSDYIRYRSLPSGFHVSPPPSLFSHLRWTNAEEYTKGISKLWLMRISRAGCIGSCLKKVAERYVVACVVGNSVSGQWMSSSHMEQVFAGTAPSDTSLSSRKKTVPKVNLFLPAHHLVESVHFTTSKGHPLHPALAIVQTPDREYFILRDNGMEVGCEEDGIWPAWMELLGCDGKGLNAAHCSSSVDQFEPRINTKNNDF